MLHVLHSLEILAFRIQISGVAHCNQQGGDTELKRTRKGWSGYSLLAAGRAAPGGRHGRSLQVSARVTAGRRA